MPLSKTGPLVPASDHRALVDQGLQPKHQLAPEADALDADAWEAML